MAIKILFREIYPNPVIYPGFTFPTNNIEVDLKKLTWAPEADDRERIDFIYYYPNKAVALKDVRIVGAEGAVLYGERIERDKDSKILLLLQLAHGLAIIKPCWYVCIKIGTRSCEQGKPSFIYFNSFADGKPQHRN